MNLCDSCIKRSDRCPIGAPGTSYCVEYDPRSRADSREAQLLFCAAVGEHPDAWEKLCWLIEYEPGLI